MAELARYVKWAGKTGGRRDKRGPRPFSDLVGRAGRPGERGPEMEEWRWRRMLGAALPGMRLDCPQEKGKKPRVQMLRELLQGRDGTDATRRAGEGQKRGALGAGGQGRAEGRADGMRGGGRRGSEEVEEGEEGM